MSHAVTHETHAKRFAAPAAVPGPTWFGAIVALWSIFVTLLIVSPETVEDTYAWLTDLSIVWEILMWIVVPPWALAYLVWESSWDQWLRILVIALLACGHLIISAPRIKR